MDTSNATSCCLAHARRKFHDLHEKHRNHIAAAQVFLGALYDVEVRAREQKLDQSGVTDWAPCWVGRSRANQARMTMSGSFRKTVPR